MKQLFILTTLLLTSLVRLDAADTPARPNILWLVSEDNNPFLGCYGDPLPHTPTLDRLAKEGVLYERCFAQPVCAPSRFALITGIHNYRPDLPYVQRLDYMFQARGYQSWQRMAAAGKLTPATAQFWGTKPTEELYDMTTDPDSVRNLAGDPAHRETLERMRAALKRHTVEINDNGFIPEGSTLEGYEASRKPGAYPIERVFALATMASERDAKNLAKMVEALDDRSEPMRWWAAQGCTMLGPEAAPAEATLRKHLDNPSGVVQVAAAEALASIGKPGLALPVLEGWLKSADAPFFGLQAANVLDRLGERARPSLPRIKALFDSLPKEAGANSPRAYLQRILERIIAVLEGREQPLVYPVFAHSSPTK